MDKTTGTYGITCIIIVLSVERLFSTKGQGHGHNNLHGVL